MKLKTMAVAAALLALSVSSAVAADSVGYNRIMVPANSDVRFSLPFNQKVEGEFTVNLVTANGMTVADSLVDNAYNGAYYVRFLSGNASGLWSTITDNGTNDFTLEDMNVLNLVSNGDSFRVYKHHTLESVFPAAMFNKTYRNGTKVLIFENDLSAMAINKAAVKSASYRESLGRWVGAGVTNATILVPDTQFILRNDSSELLELITLGDVPDYSVSVLIAANGDLNIGSGYPVPVVLNDAGLEGDSRKVLFYDNTAVGLNKAAVKSASYRASLGRWVGAGVTGDELIIPSETITLRLPASEVATKITINKPY